jgi:hypothetical protein
VRGRATDACRIAISFHFAHILAAACFLVCFRGHVVESVHGYDRMVFGRGQVIRRMPNGVLWCGSDGRADGGAVGY